MNGSGILRFAPSGVLSAYRAAVTPHPPPPPPAPPVQEPRLEYVRFLGQDGHPDVAAPLYWPIAVGGGRYVLNQILARVATGVTARVVGTYADLFHVVLPGGIDGFARASDVSVFYA